MHSRRAIEGNVQESGSFMLCPSRNHREMHGIVPQKEAKTRAEKLLIELGLKDRMSHKPNELSGGEKQRIGIARAFLHDSPLILMDEPTLNLDSLNEGIILKSLREAAEKKTVVLVSHRKSTMNIVDTVFEMKYGRIS